MERKVDDNGDVDDRSIAALLLVLLVLATPPRAAATEAG
jgi:hypothetical protein